MPRREVSGDAPDGEGGQGDDEDSADSGPAVGVDAYRIMMVESETRMMATREARNLASCLI